MDPGKLDIRVKIGARFDLALEIADDLTGDPVDLTGRTFYAQVRRLSGDTLLLSFTVTVTDAEQGQLSIVALPAATAGLVAQNCNWDLMDNFSTVWLEGDCDISTKITQLP